MLSMGRSTFWRAVSAGMLQLAVAGGIGRANGRRQLIVAPGLAICATLHTSCGTAMAELPS